MKQSISGPSLPNHKQFQDIYLQGKKAQGQLIQMPANLLETRIAVSGKARTLLGFAIKIDDQGSGGATPSQTTLVTIALNNDIIIQNTSLFLLVPDANGNVMSQEYFKYSRPLTGNDVLTITTNNPIADTFRMIFVHYYSEV